MVTVVVVLQFVVGFLQSPSVYLCHFFKFRLEVLFYLLLSDAADGCIFWEETGDACDKDQTLVFIIGL